MGVFRQSAPGEIEINIPGIAESTVNKITRLARQGSQKGDSESTDANGKKYPKGFTPPVDYYTDPGNINPDTGKPKEYGDSPLINGIFKNSTGKKNKTDFSDYKNITINVDALKISSTYFKPNEINPATNKPIEFGNYPIFLGGSRTTNDARRFSREDFYTHEDYSGAQFKYLLDYYFDSKGVPSIEKTIGFSDDGNALTGVYLGSFLRTNDDNEDPTMLSYDLIIDYDNSPLFNGTIDKFIETFPFNTEISSRMALLKDFKDQFFKFFKHNLPQSQNGPQFLGKGGVKTYYLKDLTGLNRLNESLDGTAEAKQFIDYGKDFITLGLNEDVTQNMGYLSALYKNLAWSRLHGKYIIPENLLRFDLKISITEVRKFNRVYKDTQNGLKLTEYADLISKYVYTLYECQMFFPNMPHGDTINMSATALIEKYDFKFNYKFTNLKFIKFIPPKTTSEKFTERVINNRRLDVNVNGPTDATNFFVRNRSGELVPMENKTSGVTASTTQSGNPKLLVVPVQPPKAISNIERAKLGANKAFDSLKGQLKNAVIRRANRTITNAAALLNRTLNNIYNSLAIVGPIKPPTSLYEKPDDWEQAYIDFVGPGLRTFFENPIKFTTSGDRKKLDQIVSEDPGIGTGADLGKYFSTDPNYGNAATRGKNKTLKQIVDENPSLGNTTGLGGLAADEGGTLVSNIPYLGNMAKRTRTNRSLLQLVLTSSVKKYGTVDWNDVQFPSQAHKYPPPLTTGSKKLQDIVDADPNLGNGSKLLKGFFSTNASYGNNGTIGGNLSLRNLVLDNTIITTLGAFEWNDIQFPSSAQKYPDPTIMGLNKLSDLVSQNSIATSPNYGNNATPGTNNPIFNIVKENSVALSPDYGNNGTPGVNDPLATIVEDNSNALSPDYGNNGTPGTNNPLGVIVDGNSNALSPDYGNNGTPGENIQLEDIVEVNSNALSPDYGNNATEGPNNSINTIVKNSSKTSNPSYANNATLGSNYTLEEYSKFSKSRVYGTVDWNNIQFPSSAQKYPAPITGKS